MSYNITLYSDGNIDICTYQVIGSYEIMSCSEAI